MSYSWSAMYTWLPVGGSTTFFGRDRWKYRGKCGKMVIFSGLKQGIFQVDPDTSEHTILRLF